MNYDFLLVFIGLSIVNVIFSTIRSLVVNNGGKFSASLLSGGYFAFYNIMMVYTVADFPMWQKCVITFVCNVVGVFLVKWAEEKARKDKLWKIEATFKHDDNLIAELKEWGKVNDIGFKYNDIVKYYEIDFYSHTQAESVIIKNFINKHNGKYFVAESKSL
jgi:hypothetical protein